MIALAQGCPLLSSIDLSYCQSITDAGIVALAQGCPQLRDVELQSCTAITHISIIALMRGCPDFDFNKFFDSIVPDDDE
jgi:hypothetical protein